MQPERALRARVVERRGELAVLLGSLVGFVLVTGCGVLKVEGGAGGERWPTERGDASRLNAYEHTILPPLELVWDYNASAGFGPGSAIVYEDVALVANRRGELHGIELDTGDRVGVVRFGEVIEGSPVIADRVLFVPLAWGKRTLRAYHLMQARTIWTNEGAPIEAGLLLAEGQLIAVDVMGLVRSHAPADGSVTWEINLGEVSVHAAPVLIAPGRIGIADDRGSITALQLADGHELWKADAGAPVYGGIAAVDGRIIVPTTRGRIVALDSRDGTLLWEFEVDNHLTRFSPVAAADRRIFVGGSDGTLRALDARSGRVIWTYEAQEVIAAAPLVAGEVVYVGGMANGLFALDAESGTLRWKTELDGRVKSAMAVAGPAGLLIQTEPHHIYLYETASPTQVVAQ